MDSNNSAIQVFNYNSRQVRTVEKDGEVWFIAKDVCNVLELEDVSSALRGLDTDEKMTLQNQRSHSRQRGGAQMLNIAGRKKNKPFILSWPIFASPFRQNTGKGDFFIPVKRVFRKSAMTREYSEKSQQNIPD